VAAEVTTDAAELADATAVEATYFMASSGALMTPIFCNSEPAIRVTSFVSGGFTA
jgi:hypothetical protein